MLSNLPAVNINELFDKGWEETILHSYDTDSYAKEYEEFGSVIVPMRVVWEVLGRLIHNTVMEAELYHSDEMADPFLLDQIKLATNAYLKAIENLKGYVRPIHYVYIIKEDDNE